MKRTVYQSGGYDFRPHYALVGKIIHHFNSATVLALTATAPPQLETDLSHILSLKLNVVQKKYESRKY
ncbi:hypothetical protein ACO2E5_04915 [Staphylococcus epidermidis]